MKILIRNIILAVYKGCVKYDLYMLAAMLLALLTKSLSPKRKFRILVLSKPVFAMDLESINKGSSNLQFLLFPRLLLSEYVKKYVENFDALNDGSYYLQLENTVAQNNIYHSMQRLMPHLKRLLRFDAVFAGNYVYVSQQEMFRVCQNMRIPVIVLYKEGLAPFASMTKDVNNRLYSNKKFYADKILFYNSTIRQMLVKANIPGLIAEKTDVVGVPRLDRYFKSVSSPFAVCEQHKIVLFTFEPEQKAFRYVQDKEQVPEFIERSEKFHVFFVKFCLYNPSAQLVIKTKGHPSAKTTILKILEKHSIGKLPENFRITDTDSPYELILNSDYVAGFTSTTLLEAMILNKPIISPCFQDMIPLKRTDYFAEHPEVVNYIKDYDTLASILSGKSNSKQASTVQKEKILKPLLYSLDGEASQRVIRSIENVISNSHKSNKVNSK